MSDRLLEILGSEADNLLTHTCKTVPAHLLRAPGPDCIDEVFLTRQADHWGVTIQADIIKQKLPEENGGFTAVKFSTSDPGMYDELAGNHAIDRCPYRVLNCYMGWAGFIKSGGGSGGDTDLAEAVKNSSDKPKSGRNGFNFRKKSISKANERGS